MFDANTKFILIMSFLFYWIIFGAVLSTTIAISESVQENIYKKMAKEMHVRKDGRKAVFAVIADIVMNFVNATIIYFGLVLLLIWGLSNYGW